MHPVALQRNDHIQRSATPAWRPSEPHSSGTSEARKAAPSFTPCSSSRKGASPEARRWCPPRCARRTRRSERLPRSPHPRP
eukprot:3053640-Alexandrium_andersonii.AAC.1